MKKLSSTGKKNKNKNNWTRYAKKILKKVKVKSKKISFLENAWLKKFVKK